MTEDLRFPIPGIGQNDDLEHYLRGGEGYSVPTTTGQTFSAAAKLAAPDTFIGSPWGGGAMAHKSAMRTLEIATSGDPKVSADELNKEFPGMEKPFAEPMSRRAAQILHKIHMERTHQKEIVASSRGVGSWFASLAGGAAPQVTDPSTWLAGGAVGGAMRARGIMQGAGFAAGVARSATENLVGNALLEPFIYDAAQSEQRDYDLGDSAANIIEGAAAGTAIEAGLGLVGRVAGKALGLRAPREVRRLEAESPQTLKTMEQVSAAQMQNGRAVDPSPILEARELETTSPAGTFQYRKLNADTAPGDRPFYAASEKSLGDFSTSSKVMIGYDYGKGTYLTDNPYVANGHAARELSTADGKVFEVEIDHSTTLFDLDSRLTPKQVELFQEAIGDGVDLTQDTGKYGSDIYETVKLAIEDGALPEEALDAIDAKLKEAGYDGISYSRQRDSSDPHNVIKLFGEEKVKPGRDIPPNRDMVRKVTREQHQRMAEESSSEQSRIGHDEGSYREIMDAEDEPIQTDSPNDLIEQETLALEAMTDLDKQGALDARSKELVDVVKQSQKEAKFEETVFKAAMSCFRKGT